MTTSISPYALLCSSKPRPAATMVTPYDLYSAVQKPCGNSLYAQEDIAEAASLSHNQPAPSDPPRIPYPKTHYVQDIHVRHNRAVHHTLQIKPNHP